MCQCLVFSRPFRKHFQKIALIELDVQGTLQRWWEARHEHDRKTHNVSFHNFSKLDPDQIQAGMTRLIEDYDLVLIDVPGESVSRFHTSFACAVSDLILIPMRTSTNDEDAFEANLLPIIDQLLEHQPEKRGCFFIIPTFTHPRAREDRVIAYFEEILPEYIGCLNAVFPNRTVYENCNREGLHLYEYSQWVKGNKREYKQAKNAERDIASIGKELLKGVLRNGALQN